MENSKGPRRIDSKAYRIFRSECVQHLQALSNVLGEDESDLTQEESEASSIRCHTMKGGAGFFGLEELAKCSGKLEKLFAGWALSKNLKEAHSGFEELKKLIGKLPEPPTQPDDKQ